MAYAGIACLLIGVTVATLLYYMFGDNVREGTPVRTRRHDSENIPRYRSNGYYEPKYNTYSNDYDESQSRITDSDKCTICLNSLTIGRRVILRTCNHAFHKKCIDEWKNRSDQKSCPNCRRAFE